MIIRDNISLKEFNTFGLDYKADLLIILETEQETLDFFREKGTWMKPLLILGGGSNLLFLNDYKGTIIHPVFGGIKTESRDGNDVLISAGAGVKWDDLVEWSVNEGLFGLENLSLIPGTAGASVVQNIGAYGAEISELAEKAEAIRINDGTLHVFSNRDCEFAYRSSIFKQRLKGQYFITRVWFRLKNEGSLKLNYGSLHDEVRKLGSETLINARKAVINIRRSKLPDPEITGNAGSFFKNPVVTGSMAEELLKNFPGMPLFWEKTGSIKLAAGWLIEQCGWKGKRKGDAGVHDRQALIIVNHGNASGKEIYRLSEEIKRSVAGKFGIELDREVEVIGTI